MIQRILAGLLAISLAPVFTPIVQAAEIDSAKVESVKTESVLPAPEAANRKWKTSGALMVSTATNIDPDVPRDVSGMYFGSITLSRLKPDATEEALPEYTLTAATGIVTNYSREGGGVGTAFGDDLVEDDRFGVINPMFSIGKPLGSVGALEAVNLRSRLTIGGVSRRSRSTSFLGSLGVTGSYEKNLGVLSEKLSKATFTQSLLISYAQFEFETNRDGRYNKPLNLILNQGLRYAVSDKWTASASAGVGQSHSYTGTISYFTVAGIDAGYKVTDQLSASAGVSTQAGTWAPNGQEVEIILFRPDLAITYFDLSLAL